MKNTGTKQIYSNRKIFAYWYNRVQNKLWLSAKGKAIKLLCGVFIVNKCRFVHVVVWDIMVSPQTLNQISKLKEKYALKWIVANISCIAGCMFWWTVAVQPQQGCDYLASWLLVLCRRCLIHLCFETIVGSSKFRHILKLTNESGRRLSRVQWKWIQAKVTV